MTSCRKPDLVCPAGSLPALKAAIDEGADAVYCGFRDATNARNFAGLNFDRKALETGIAYAHARRREVLIAINTHARAGQTAAWHAAVDQAAELGVDALILADPALMRYAAKTHPQLRLHCSVQGSVTNHEAINFLAAEFGIRRAVIPRVLTLEQIEALIEKTEVEIEVFGFGSLCVMNEGRCWLSSYATGHSPNTHGVCSPASHVRWEEQGADRLVRLNGILIDRFGADEKAGYPTICKGRYEVEGAIDYAIEEPASLNVLPMLDQLVRIGVAAIKVEGRQRSPAYTAKVTRTLRAAIDAASGPARYSPRPEWLAALAEVSEGQSVTLGAYSKPWR
ncbi:MAG: peptidase U32 family protein [Burkholderiaceae bacterium]